MCGLDEAIIRNVFDLYLDRYSEPFLFVYGTNIDRSMYFRVCYRICLLSLASDSFESAQKAG